MCDCENPETPECIAECAAQDITTSTFFQAVGDKKGVLIGFIFIAMVALLNWIVYAATNGQDLVGMAAGLIFPPSVSEATGASKINPAAGIIQRSVLGLIGAVGLVLGIMAASA